MNGSIETVNATLQTSMPLSSWLPLHNAAGAFREECSSLEQFTQELFTDLERLGGELETKADELEDSRRHLADRGRQLAEQRKESARLSHQLEQQETLLSESLAELRELRAELANRPEPVAAPDLAPELNGLRHQITELQVERAILLERLKAAENQVSQSRNGEPTTPPIAVLSADSLQGLSDKFAEQFSLLQEQLAASQPNPTTAAELEILKQELLQQQENQLMLALAELRAMQAEFVNRPEAAPAPQEDLQSLSAQFSQQFVALHERIQDLQPNPPEVTQAELEILKQELLQQQENQLMLALAELRAMQAEFVNRPEAALAPQEDLQSLFAQFSQQFVALHERIQDLQPNPPEVTQLKSLQQERQELEVELELVRARSADLQETVTRQKRELAVQQSEVNAELKELRVLIAEQGERFVQQVSETPEPAAQDEPSTEKQYSTPSPVPVSVSEQTSAKPANPVVNSVMAQFAKLQRDIAQRRKKK